MLRDGAELKWTTREDFGYQGEEDERRDAGIFALRGWLQNNQIPVVDHRIGFDFGGVCWGNNGP